jgi:hypothetical protein
MVIGLTCMWTVCHWSDLYADCSHCCRSKTRADCSRCSRSKTRADCSRCCRDELFPEIQKLVLIQNEQMYKTDTKFKFTMVWPHPFSELSLHFLDPQSQAPPTRPDRGSMDGRNGGCCGSGPKNGGRCSCRSRSRSQSWNGRCHCHCWNEFRGVPRHTWVWPS